jgi:hypothetical protein
MGGELVDTRRFSLCPIGATHTGFVEARCLPDALLTEAGCQPRITKLDSQFP